MASRAYKAVVKELSSPKTARHFKNNALFAQFSYMTFWVKACEVDPSKVEIRLCLHEDSDPSAAALYNKLTKRLACLLRSDSDTLDPFK